MIQEINGYKAFGVWEGMSYGEPDSAFPDFEGYHDLNTIDKAAVIKHIKALPDALSSFKTYDIFTGNKISDNAGFYEDGVFSFPIDFLYYYTHYDIGIPPEYEQYLLEEVGLPPGKR